MIQRLPLRVRSHRTTFIALLLLVACALSATAPLAQAKGKKKEKEPEVGDVNEYSLRVTAMEVLYELDLSVEQLQLVRDAGAGSADDRHRNAPAATPKMVEALKALEQGLLKQEDREQIAKLKDAVAESHDDDAVHLDDEVRPTDAARVKAVDLLRHLKASQLAAYLADHADEVADPAERMMDALVDIRDPDATEVDALVQETASEVGRLASGLDGAKGKEIAEGVVDWLRANKRLSDQEFSSRHAELEDSARKVVGDLSPVEVLSHFLENEIAMLISNPELPQAVDATVAARK
jgi:hypothetical protein